ncbi:unnamed protein product [Angiostrongylus costaricensis]|uniref:CPG4 domain-containing protein n=1 Tax=Angiostrongylus costaricensis TaxID=334426 RepID=A0A0R3Q011_ANGCS|nr:unnamed protein product [Angiostrongylus costaricensis]
MESTYLFRLNTVYQQCLSMCPENPAKRILMSGQTAWNIICDDFRNDTGNGYFTDSYYSTTKCDYLDFREVVVPCWSTMGETLTSHCAPMAHFLQAEILQLMEGGLENVHQGLDGLCRCVHSYDKCFVRKNYEACGSKAGKFLVKLTHQTSHALMELLDKVLKLNDLPRSCKDWLSQKDIGGLRPRAIARRLRNSCLALADSIPIIFVTLKAYLFV